MRQARGRTTQHCPPPADQVASGRARRVCVCSRAARGAITRPPTAAGGGGLSYREAYLYKSWDWRGHTAVGSHSVASPPGKSVTLHEAAGSLWPRDETALSEVGLGGEGRGGGHERLGTASLVVGRGSVVLLMVVVVVHGLIDGFGGGVVLGDPRAQPEGLPARFHCLPCPAGGRIRPSWRSLNSARDGRRVVSNISHRSGGGRRCPLKGSRSGLGCGGTHGGRRSHHGREVGPGQDDLRMTADPLRRANPSETNGAANQGAQLQDR